MTRQLDTPLYERIAAMAEIADIRGSDDQVAALRKRAYQIFQQTGFPSIKNEEWRFTNILPFLKNINLNIPTTNAVTGASCKKIFPGNKGFKLSAVKKINKIPYIFLL